MSTLAIVEQVMRQTKAPMSVREIVDFAGTTLPTRSKTPETVVARDLSVSIKRFGDESVFVRTATGRYTLREFVLCGLIKMGDVGAQKLSVYQGHRKDESQREALSILGHALSEERVGTLPAKRELKERDGQGTAGSTPSLARNSEG